MSIQQSSASSMRSITKSPQASKSITKQTNKENVDIHSKQSLTDRLGAVHTMITNDPYLNNKRDGIKPDINTISNWDNHSYSKWYN